MLAPAGGDGVLKLNISPSPASHVKAEDQNEINIVINSSEPIGEHDAEEPASQYQDGVEVILGSESVEDQEPEEPGVTENKIEDVANHSDERVTDSCPCAVEPTVVHRYPEEKEDGILAPVVLDVGFAQVELKKTEEWPKYEFYILAKDGFLTSDGAAALFDFLDFVLNLADVVSTGFVLTYDLRCCACPQLDLVSWIMHYISDPVREEAWHERCVCWKVVVPPGMYFTMAQSALAFLFTVCPPKCKVFLMTDLDTSKAKNWICYQPEELADERPSLLSTISSGFFDTFFPACHEIPPTESSSAPVCMPPVEQAAATDNEIFYDAREEEDDHDVIDSAESFVGSQHLVDSPSMQSCADSLLTSFAEINQGIDASSGLAYLQVIGRGAPMSNEGLEQIMDSMDNFVNSHSAQRGFSITYDLRRLGIPSMSMVMRVAEWGNQPERQAKWTRLNKACKVVVSSGLKFSVCKGVLKSFFYICPPVCRTFLLTDLHEPDDKATIFEPLASKNSSEEDSQSEDPEANSDDGCSSCGRSVDTSETTSASSSGSTKLEANEDPLNSAAMYTDCKHKASSQYVGADADEEQSLRQR
jgi:hypothetical protein